MLGVASGVQQHRYQFYADGGWPQAQGTSAEVG